MKLKIKNFRSIRDQEIELAPLTVVYGPNGAGKSTLLYSPMTMRNIILNPNQESSGFFNYHFVDLGDFEKIIFDHKPPGFLEFTISIAEEYFSMNYSIGIFAASIINFDLEIVSGIGGHEPYP